MRNQKGVSLITLVITIIVVIILAAIALGGGATDSIGQSQFSGFASEIAALQDAAKTAAASVKGKEAIRGTASRTDAQIYNYVARGGEAAGLGDTDWLAQSAAAAIDCTLIDPAKADGSLGMQVPKTKVETARGTNQPVSYFVTPKGQVFCWPPYLYDDKSYVTNSVTAKNGTDEYSGTTATEAATTITLTFPLTEETVQISNADSTTPTAIATTTAATGLAATHTSVWYNALGVAPLGYNFTGYNNTTVTP